MTTRLADLPAESIRAALADPRNSDRASQEALQRALASRGGTGTPGGENVAQRAAQVARKPHKRRGVPNQTEARYARDILGPLLVAGSIVQYEYEAVTWHIYNIGTYTPDWLVRLPDGGLWNVEIKGGLVRPQALVRWKAHSAVRPWMRWTMIQYHGGAWKTLHDRPARVSSGEVAT